MPGIPPMPPIGGADGAGGFSSGISETIASVVINVYNCIERT